MTERKRESIVEAAIEEFRLNGFEATSMDRIASVAGVSKRTVYNHFPSKDVLFDAILTQLYHRMHEGLGVAYSRERPLRDQLEELLWQKMQLLNDGNFIDLARVAISEAINSPQRAREMVSRMSEREEGLKIWIRAAVADGKLKIKDPAFAADQMQGLIKGFAFWPQISLAQPPLTTARQKQVIESAVKMFLLSYS
jgi:TetR/AcrR family transcriptional regulator of autoinduction and epiphytic fitness